MSQSLASRGSRLGAVLLDNLAVLVALLPSGLALISAVDGYGNDGMGGALVLLAFGFFGMLGVQIYLLAQKGQTIGKRMVGIRIVDHSTGDLAGAGRILGLREFLRGLVSGIPYIGWLLILIDILAIFGEDHRCIHDYIARTMVVAVSDGDKEVMSKEVDRAPSEADPATDAATSSEGTDREVTDGEATRFGSPVSDTSPPVSSEPSPAVPDCVKRLREVLQNIEELHDECALTDEKLARSKRRALADMIAEAEADPDAILDGLEWLREEGLLDEADVRTAKSIL